jgi:hypothetical protein
MRGGTVDRVGRAAVVVVAIELRTPRSAKDSDVSSVLPSSQAITSKSRRVCASSPASASGRNFAWL